MVLEIEVLLVPTTMQIFETRIRLSSSRCNTRFLNMAKDWWPGRWHWTWPLCDLTMSSSYCSSLVSELIRFTGGYIRGSLYWRFPDSWPYRLGHLSLYGEWAGVAMTAFHVVIAIPGARKAVSRLRPLAVGIQAKERFYSVPVRAMGLSLMTQATCGRGESETFASLNLAPVRFEVRINMFAVTRSVWRGTHRCQSAAQILTHNCTSASLVRDCNLPHFQSSNGISHPHLVLRHIFRSYGPASHLHRRMKEERIEALQSLRTQPR